MRSLWVVRASTALFGFSLAIALAPRLRLPAQASDPLSALKVAGYSPKGLLLQFGLAVALTAILAIVGDRVARRLVAYRWAAVSYCGALLLAPVVLMVYGNVRHLVMLGASAAAIFVLRKRDPHFTRRDVILIPAFLSCYIAFLDLHFGGTPVGTMVRAAIAVFFLRVIVSSSEAFILAPLSLVAEIGWLPPFAGAVVALTIIFATPFVLARTNFRIPPKVVYPIVVFLYPLAVLRMPSPITTSNFFEDSHEIVVATEMMRGEKPYTDIIPTHGLISDGGLDFLTMKSGGRSLRTILNTRLFFGVLSGVAIYCVAFAATGVAEAGLLAALLAFALSPGMTLWLRPSAALFALAATIAATRLRSRRWFMIAGALVVLAFLVSVDFGVYSALVALFAAARSRAWRELAIGIAAAAAGSLIVFAIFGFAVDFVRVNIFEIFGGHGVGYVGPLRLPECLHSPALFHHLPYCIAEMMWVVGLITACAMLARSPLRARRSDAPWLIGIWMVVAAAAYIRRGNIQFNPAVAPFIVAAIWTLGRYARTVAIVLAAAILLIAEPVRHVITVIPELREAQEKPLFDPATAASIAAARRYIATLGPGETFIDFANSAMLFSLLGRDCPLRQVEVANYQADDAQREVIERIERNRNIRAALIAFPGSLQNIDGLTNAQRAPLVWEYLQKNFAPAFDADGVVFWKRVR